MPRTPISAVVALVLALPASCVSKSTYEKAVADAQGAHEESARKQKEIDALHARLGQAEKDAQARDETIAKLQSDQHNLQQSLDETTAMNRSLRDELTRLGKDVDKVLAEKGALATELRDAKSRLDELRRAQQAAEARAATFRDVLARLKKLVDAGALKIAMRDGRLVIQLPNDILFESGSDVVKPQGRGALKDLADVLRTIPNRKFQVAGDTDDVPIATTRFPSNWDLSTARAVSVVKLLVADGVNPRVLSAAGYGEFDPVASNADPQGRARNRRIEITLVPNLDELYALPEPK
jgi:chemotaxis protein MotB